MKFRPIALLAAVAAVAMMAFASMAQAATPKAGYERFAGCPSKEENPLVQLCQRGVIDGGHFQMGSKDVPITNPITLVAGVDGEGHLSANSLGGITPVKQKVPGGIIGLTGLTWLAEFLGSEALTLYAVTELAGQPILGENSQSLQLPIRVHLINSALGNNCYVGSFASPIKLNLTYGTTSPPSPNKPITGTQPVQAPSDLEKVIRFENGVLVDNAFAAPGASGCTLTLFGLFPINLNPLVNLQSGLPSPAGTNETTQNLDLEIVNRKVVYP